MNFREKSLRLHEQLKGKIEIRTKYPVQTKDDLSLVYSPGVAEPAKKIAQNQDDVYKYTLKGNTVAVVSDGSAVLGLGNVGAYAALPVMGGKAALLKEFANLNAFPICLETQDVKTTITTIKNISPTFGGIILEDIKAPECFEIEDALQDLGIPVMHDDQHGTAIVALIGLINASKVVGKKFEDLKIVINGAGAAGLAIARLLTCVDAGKTFCPKPNTVIVVDSKGTIYEGREGLNPYKKDVATFTNREKCTGGLADALTGADVFIGVSKPRLLKPAMIKAMNEKPIIFALANPDPEIMPDEAKKAGAAVVATGRSDYPNQVNNVLCFPGLFKGALEAHATRITQRMKIAAAYAVASLIEDPTPECILPSPMDARVVPAVAQAVKDCLEDEA